MGCPDISAMQAAGSVRLRAQFRALQMGDVLEGDGKIRACLRLHGEKGRLDLMLALDLKSSKVQEVTVTRPCETAFVP